MYTIVIPEYARVNSEDVDCDRDYSCGVVTVSYTYTDRNHRDGSTLLSKTKNNILIIDYEMSDNDQFLSISDRDIADNFLYVISAFFTAAFGAFFPKGVITVFDNKFVHYGDYCNSINNDASDGTMASCLYGTMDTKATITNALLSKESWKLKSLVFLERACMFYTEAINEKSRSIDVSYSLLISSLECLAASLDIDSEDLMDSEDRELLLNIVNHKDFGDACARRIKSRFYQLKRKCILTVETLCDTDIYIYKHEKNDKDKKVFVEPSEWGKRIAASYDLRSAYLHSGKTNPNLSYSWWRKNNQNIRATIVESKQSEQTLKNCLNFYQLSNIVQHCLSFRIRELLCQNN